MTEKHEYEKALEHVQNQEFFKALAYLNKEEDKELFAELDYLASAVSNYQDRLVDDLAKKISEEGENPE